MATIESVDFDRILQEELDAISLGDEIEDSISDEENQYDYKIEEEHAQLAINETRERLESAMKERLAAFENEMKMNMKLYEIDYDEIDELLQKPIGNYEQEIENNVARHFGIEQDEVHRILESINAEESCHESSDESEVKDNDCVEEMIPVVKPSSPAEKIEQKIESPPPENEDPNKKIYDERLAESHRRMLDELAFLDQRRKEEEQRYAIALQEQQARLAEEYRRLQENLDENVRQTQHEKSQLQNLLQEQERVMSDRQIKMATIIQAWYRGRRVYRQYHEQIRQRTAPILRAIIKQRKKKEQEAAAMAAAAVVAATKLNKIEEISETTTDENVKSVAKLDEKTSLAAASKETAVSETQKSNQGPPKSVHIIPSSQNVNVESTVSKDETKKKKKNKEKSLPDKKLVTNRAVETTEIIQMENPADFIPTVVPERKPVLSPRLTQTVTRTPIVPKPPDEQRPKSSDRPPRSARTPLPAEPLPPIIRDPEPIDKPDHKKPTSPRIRTPRSIINTEKPSEPKQTKIENSIPPLERCSTFEKEIEFSTVMPLKLPDSMDKIEINEVPVSFSPAPNHLPSSRQSIQTPRRIPSATPRNDEIETIHTFSLNKHDLNPLSTVDQLVDKTSLEEKRHVTPRPTTPLKQHKQTRESKKIIDSFLNEAQQWARRTQEMTLALLLSASEETAQQISVRKIGSNIRKLADLDPQIITKLAKNRTPHEIEYLLVEQILNPCSLSLISTTFTHLTHLALRQCKLVQLTGLDSCSTLKYLDVENNWLEQIHLQLNELEYLNMSRNRITSLLSMQTPKLRYLDVSNNRLTRLNGIEALVNLNVLLATSNQLLTTIGLQGCTRLLVLDLSDNHLVEMDQLDQCPLLLTVKAMSNALIQIPNLFNAVLLHELDLSSNSLSSLDELSIGQWLPFLSHLRLCSNSLQDLSPIQLPSLQILELPFNQLNDGLMLKKLIQNCPSLIYVNLEQNPVLYDKIPVDEKLLKPPNKAIPPISILPNWSDSPSIELIQNYLNFLTNITSMCITLRQNIERCQNEPRELLNTIHQQCRHYQETKPVAPIRIPTPEPVPPVKVVSLDDQRIVRIQAHWRRRLIEQNLKKQTRAAILIQARWRGYVVRQRIRAVRQLFQHQPQTIYDEIDLTEFDFDEAAFDARFQPLQPPARIKHVWQAPPDIDALAQTTTMLELSRPRSSRSSSAASSRAKPVIEPLAIPTKTSQIANEWGFTPSSSTAALMLKRAERMKWNVERKHKREQMDAFQRLQLARQSELPPGSLRLAKRQPAIPNTKQVATANVLSPPSTAQSRPNRVFEWVHTQVARFDEPPPVYGHNPKHERKRLPSLDGSSDASSRVRTNEILSKSQQDSDRWSAPSITVRQPPTLLPPIHGQPPRP